MITEEIIFLIVYLISALCFRVNKPVSIALFIGNTAGLILPEFGLNHYRSFFFLFSAAICLMTFKGWKPSIKKLDGNEINHAVSYLYCVRVVVDLPRISGFAGVEVTWIISMIFLFMQLILSLGDGAGYGSPINNYLSKCRSRINAFIFQ